MRRFLYALAFVCAAIAVSFGQNTTTLSAHIADLGGTAQASKTFLRVELKGDGGQSCRVAGTGVITPYSKDFSPDSSGNISATVYKTSSVTCGSSTGNSKYLVTLFYNGQPQHPCYLQISSATTLESASCLNAIATPVVAQPTDSVYARVDGSNAGFTGNLTLNSHNITGIGNLTATGTTTLGTTSAGAVTATSVQGPVGTVTPNTGAFTTTTVDKLNNRIWVGSTTYPFTATGAQQALTDACGNFGGALSAGTKVYFPPGSLTANLTITCPLIVEGAGWGQTTINGTTGAAITLAPSANFSPNNQYWDISGFTLTSGSAQGIFINDATNAVGNLYIHGNQFFDTCATCQAIENSSSTAANGEQVLWIEHNQFTEGTIFLHVTGAGTTGVADGTYIANNFFSDQAAAGHTTPCMTLNTFAGAAQLTVFHNTIGGCGGGEILSAGTLQPYIVDNQMEQNSGTGTASGCLIELTGTNFSVAAPQIIHNNLNGHTTVLHGVCLGTTSNALIDHNTFTVPTGGSAILANSDFYLGSHNVFSLTGTAARTSGTGVPQGDVANVCSSACSVAARASALGATTLYTPTGPARIYRVCAYLFLTQAATTSSALGGTTGVQITYQSGFSGGAPTDNIVMTDQSGALVTTATGNTRNTANTNSAGCRTIFANPGVAISATIGYTSSGATAMQYGAKFTVEPM